MKARAKPRPPHIGTIGSTIRVGHEMMVHCDNRLRSLPLHVLQAVCRSPLRSQERPSLAAGGTSEKCQEQTGLESARGM
jgi:hypothetical protein